MTHTEKALFQEAIGGWAADLPASLEGALRLYREATAETPATTEEMRDLWVRAGRSMPAADWQDTLLDNGWTPAGWAELLTRTPEPVN